MDETAVTVSPSPTDFQESGAVATAFEDRHIVEELLVEEISIDGMCGVY